MTGPIDAAIQLALKWHEGQCYPITERLVLTHVLSVGFDVAQHGFDGLAIAAGIGHELLDATDCPPTDIAVACGNEVLTIIQTLSLDSRFDTPAQWQTQREAYIQAVQHSNENTKAVVLFDHIQELKQLMSALEAYGLPYFEQTGEIPEKRLWYEDQVCLMLQNSFKHTAVSEFDQQIERFVKILETLDTEEKQGITRSPLPTNCEDFETTEPTQISWSEPLSTEEFPSLIRAQTEVVKLHNTKGSTEKAGGLQTQTHYVPKYLEAEAFGYLVPIAITLGLQNQGLSNLILQDQLHLSFQTANNVLKELKRLKIIERVDGIKLRPIQLQTAKEVLAAFTNSN